jgi:hypothetical protein
MKKALQFVIGLLIISNGAFAQAPVLQSVPSISNGYELLFSDYGQIRSMDNNHRILFRRSDNALELREFGRIIFSSGAENGDETANMVLSHDGFLGIGNPLPHYKLDIKTTNSSDGIRLVHNVQGIEQGFVDFKSNSLQNLSFNNITHAGDAGIIYGSLNSNPLNFGFVIAPWVNAASGLRVDKDGNVGIATGETNGYQLAVNGNSSFTGAVGIGTTNTGSFKLAVEGKIGARGIKVTMENPFPDYVFEPTYQLRPLAHLEQYINQNKHLPGIPSAAEVKKEGGIELGDMNVKLLEKIEELTLYVIELKKENEQMKKEIAELKQKK